MSFGFGIGDFLVILKLAKELKDRFAQAPKQYRGIYQEVESISIVLHRIEELDEDDFEEEQVEEIERILQNCQDLLSEISLKLDKLQVLSNDSSPDWKQKARRTWKRITWDQKEINEYRSRIVSNITFFNLLMGGINQGLTVDIAHGIKELSVKQDVFIQKQDRKQEDQERDKILSWISPTCLAARQNEVFKSRQEGTGTWLLKTEEFTHWLSQEKQILLCTGIPGAGKTVLVSMIIDYLETTFSGQDDIGIAYYFCDFRQEQPLLGIYSAILRQFLQGKASIPEHITALHQKHNQRGTIPSVNDILEALKVTMNKYRRNFIILDALDECPLSDPLGSVRYAFLRKILSLPNDHDVSILATSRIDQEIIALFEGGTSMEIRATQGDIQQYIDVRLNDLRPFVHRKPDLKQCIKDEITDAAQGMFLLARLYLNLLTDQPNEKGIRKVLTSFSGGSGTNIYEAAYDQTVKRMESQSSDALELAKRTIGWIANAKRPLTVEELEEALAIEIDSAELDETNITDIEQLTSYCCGLVMVDETTQHVKLVHYTTQTYFEGLWETWCPEIHQIISDSCLTYVAYDSFEEAASDSIIALDTLLSNRPFYKYPVHYWGHHFREHPGSHDMALDYLRNQNKAKIFAFYFEKLENRFKIYRDSLRKISESSITVEMSGIHLASRFGLCELVEDLLDEEPSNIDVRDYSGRNALHIALSHDHEKVVNILLNRGANIESRDKMHHTPMHRACEIGNDRIVSTLLKSGASVTHWAIPGLTPLHFAAGAGHETTAKLLLANGADINFPGGCFETPLFQAARKGRESMAQLLLDHGAYVNFEHYTGATALHAAITDAIRPIPDVVRLLVNNGASIKIQASKEADLGQNLLHLAIRKRQNEVAQYLMSLGLKFDSVDRADRTLLHIAVMKGNEAGAELLLRKAQQVLPDGSYVNFKDGNGDTPLNLAIWHNNNHTFEIIELLMKNGADINTENYWGNTPLAGAAIRWEVDVTRVLLENGADPNLPDDNHQEPDMLYLPYGRGPHDHEFLPDHLFTHAFPCWRLQCRRPLQWAISQGHEDIAKLLLASGADPNIPDMFGRTALHTAVCSGQIEMVRLLLTFPGIDEFHVDNWGLTAFRESRRRQHDEISIFFENREVRDSPSEENEDDSDEIGWHVSPHICYICLKKVDDSKERYFLCRNLAFCEFCPPLESEMDERLCPACGECLIEGELYQESDYSDE